MAVSAKHIPEQEQPQFTTGRTKRLRGKIVRLLLRSSLVLVFLLGVGAIYQFSASAYDQSSYPAPGKLVDVGGYRLHLFCTGSARSGQPTVVLEAGLGGTSLDWSKVQPQVARFTRVCSYDRAGYGWSDSGPSPRTSRQEVAELHMLLAKGQLSAPFLLVAHSFGGLNAQLYAFTYPGEIAGLILVDSQHCEMLARSPAFRTFITNEANTLATFSFLAPSGLLRLLIEIGVAPLTFARYPTALQDTVKSFAEQTRFPTTAREEEVNLEQSMSQVCSARYTFARLPLMVLTRGEFAPEDEKQLWLTLQEELVHLSAVGTHITASGSGHGIMLDDPELVTDSIKHMMAEGA